MSITDEIREAEKVSQTYSACKVCRLLVVAPEEDLQAISEALRGTISAVALAGILQRHGYDVGRDSILRHRKGHQ